MEPRFYTGKGTLTVRVSKTQTVTATTEITQ